MALDAGTVNGTPVASVPRTPQKPSVAPNVLEVVFGSLLIKPWYPSFYPEQIVGRKVERLYVCQWCFKYSKELAPFLGHLVRLGRFSDVSPLTFYRKHALIAAPHHLAPIYTPRAITRYMRSMAKRTSSMHRTYVSLRSCSSTPSPSSTT